MFDSRLKHRSRQDDSWEVVS